MLKHQIRNYCEQSWKVILKQCGGNVLLSEYIGHCCVKFWLFVWRVYITYHNDHFVGYHCHISQNVLFVLLKVQSVFVKLYSWPVMVVIISSLHLVVSGPCGKTCDHHTCVLQLGFHMLRKLYAIECKLGAFLCFKFFIILTFWHWNLTFKF
jgi:hypothetical protein